MKAFFRILLLLPLAVVVLAFALANRQMASVSFDVFGTQSPALNGSWPMFLVLFASVMVGILIGGVASWFSQGKLRRDAHRYRAEAERLRAETNRRGEPNGGGKALAMFSGGRAA
jgi:uncharacterized integral membrane protein